MRTCMHACVSVCVHVVLGQTASGLCTYTFGLMTRLFLGSSELLTSFRLLLECLAFGLLLCFLLLLLSCSISLSEDDSEEEEELEEESESSECIGFFLFFSRTFNKH